MSSAISVDGVSKLYLIGHQTARASGHVTLRETIGREARNFGRKTTDFFRGRQIVQGDELEQLWALKDVSFEVRRGEVLGIVGRNGAGKSTLLKILSRITEPTQGRVVLNGRVATLLEVGTGFHAELTGRENIFLNGTILGMTRAEILAKFDEIVAFAEVDKFLDTPVKRYSSGMYLRLGFAIAAHLDPDILIVDEVLSVGDAAFQKKSLGKMNDLTRSGRTVLFVSHNMTVIAGLCTRCILLDAGKLLLADRADAVISAYARNLAPPSGGERILAKPDSNPIYVTRLALVDANGAVSDNIEMGSDATLEIDYTLDKTLNTVTMALLLSREGVQVLYSYDVDADESIREQRAGGRYRARIPLPLGIMKEGSYTAEVKIGWNRTEVSDPRAVLTFDIVNRLKDLTHRSYRSDRPGALALDLDWHTRRCE